MFNSFFELLKNDNVSQLGMDKNLTTALYSKTRKPAFIFDETKTPKSKNKKMSTCIT